MKLIEGSILEIRQEKRRVVEAWIQDMEKMKEQVQFNKFRPKEEQEMIDNLEDFLIIQKLNGHKHKSKTTQDHQLLLLKCKLTEEQEEFPISTTPYLT